MKKVSINLTLDDNEIFEKSVKEALVSQAKQISREEIDKVLKFEIERIATSKVLELKNGGYYSTVISRITESVANRLERELTLDTTTINAMVEEKVNRYLDTRIEKYGGVDKYVQNYINNAIASLLTNK